LVTALEDGTAVVSLDERRLLSRHLEGDQRAFAELVRAYRSPVYGYLVRCGVPSEARDDLFQEIFMKIHRAATSYAPERALQPWLFTIVANTVRSHFRKKKVESLVFSEARATEPESNAPSVDQLTEAKETAAWIERTLEKLPLEQREVVVLACIESMSMRDVGEVLDLPQNTVKTLLRRARMTLATELARRNLRAKREAAR
jgi:RNA polymerase sigma-70 factor (ECF subfamily)